MTPLARRALRIAKARVGQREATGRNDGPFVRMVQRFIAAGERWLDGQPWCVCFALWAVHTAARELGTVSGLPRTASSSGLYRWLRRHGKLLARPVPGCIGIVRGGATGHRHTFLVHAVHDGTVIGVDGNYRNAVGWSRRPVAACDYGEIC